MSLHSLKRLCLLHVIANQCAHWCGNPFSLRQRKTKSTTLGEYEKRHEFALSKTCLPSISAEMRIATSLRSSQ